MIVKCSDKNIVQQLINQCYGYGVRHVVISPGSRNAPLTISFSENAYFTCYSVPDERSAAFFALGLAKQAKAPVVLVCTSGTAVLNYAPAICEAFYQEVSLIVLTADRPQEWIDQEDGQTIHQVDIYKNYIRLSVNLPDKETEKDLAICKDLINNAFIEALGPVKGPVHINIPLHEPLYHTVDIDFDNNISYAIAKSNKVENFDHLVEAWNKADKVMVLAGVLFPDIELNHLLSEMAGKKQIVVVAPPISNLESELFIATPEILFNTISDEEKKWLQPDLLISLGGPVVSKATKLFLRQYKPKRHFDIDLNPNEANTYQALTDKIISDHSEVFNYVKNKIIDKPSDYFNCFFEIYNQKKILAHHFIESSDFSDLKIYASFFKQLTEKVNLHLANSTPVRYIDLFIKHPLVNYYVNRGTSGIDGNTSVAMGAANVDSAKTVLITGDVSFMYDSNAFWHSHHPSNLKIILINNGGGNIFRIINGPTIANGFNYFETPPQHSVEKFCHAFNVNYLNCNSNDVLDATINNLLSSTVCTVLEIITNNEISASFYKKLFQHLRKK